MNLWKQTIRNITADEARLFQKEWGWKIDASYEPLWVSIFGDVFLERAGEIFLLNTGTAELEKSITSHEELEAELQQLASSLKNKIGQPNANECYSYNILPIFKEGSYDVSNFHLLSLKEHFGVTSSIHQQLKETPDGESVRLKVVP